VGGRGGRGGGVFKTFLKKGCLGTILKSSSSTTTTTTF